MGLALIDAGHDATEAAALPALRSALAAAARAQGLSAELVESAVPAAIWADYQAPGAP